MAKLLLSLTGKIVYILWNLKLSQEKCKESICTLLFDAKCLYVVLGETSFLYLQIGCTMNAKSLHQ